MQWLPTVNRIKSLVWEKREGRDKGTESKDKGKREKGKKTSSISSASPLRRPTMQTLQSNFQFPHIPVSLTFASHFAYNTPLFTHQALWKHLPLTTKNYREVEIKENEKLNWETPNLNCQEKKTWTKTGNVYSRITNRY